MRHTSQDVSEEHRTVTERLTLTTADILVIAAILLVTVWTSHRRSAKSSDAIDYLLAGRTLTLPFFVASLVATWYGAVLGSGEFVVRTGLTMILCFGVPYYLAATVYAIWLAKRIRQSDALSVPDQFAKVYGAKGRFWATGIMFIVSSPAAYQLMIGVVISSVTGVQLWISVLMGTALSLIVIYRGGLRSDVRANVVQMLVMYGGFIVLAISSIQTLGNPSDMWTALPDSHKGFPGTIGWGAVAAWWLLALQTFIDPNFHMRAAAAATVNTARRGILISVALWMIFDGLQLMTGLYAVTLVTESQALNAYVVLAERVLSPVWKGLFLSGVLAAVMSTLDGYALASAALIPIRSRSIALLVTTGLGAVAAIVFPSVVELLFAVANLAVPALLLPLLLSFTSFARRLSHIGITILLPAVSVVFTYVATQFGIQMWPPMMIGLLMSAVITSVQVFRHANTE